MKAEPISGVSGVVAGSAVEREAGPLPQVVLQAPDLESVQAGRKLLVPPSPSVPVAAAAAPTPQKLRRYEELLAAGRGLIPAFDPVEVAQAPMVTLEGGEELQGTRHKALVELALGNGAKLCGVHKAAKEGTPDCEAETAAVRLCRLIGLPAVEPVPRKMVLPEGEVDGYIKPFIPNDGVLDLDPKNWTAEQRLMVLAYFAVTRVMRNEDTKPGQYLSVDLPDGSGSAIAVDQDRSLRGYDDDEPLARFHVRPESQGRVGKPRAEDLLFNGYVNGDFELDFGLSLEMARRIGSLSDEAWDRVVGPYFERAVDVERALARPDLKPATREALTKEHARLVGLRTSNELSFLVRQAASGLHDELSAFYRGLTKERVTYERGGSKSAEVLAGEANLRAQVAYAASDAAAERMEGQRQKAQAKLQEPHNDDKHFDLSAVDPAMVQEIHEYREAHRAAFEWTLDLLAREFPQHKTFGRLKETERILEAFGRKGLTKETIPDIVGTQVMVESLDEGVAVALRLQDILRANKFEVVYPEAGLSSETLRGRVYTIKRQFRTYGMVFKFESGDRKVEVSVQTQAQGLWSKLVHDTPVYKPRLFQRAWGVDDRQVEQLRDYAFAVSEYLHCRALGTSVLQRYWGAPPNPPRPIKPDLGPNAPAIACKLIDDLEALLGQLEGVYGQHVEKVGPEGRQRLDELLRRLLSQPAAASVA